MLGITSSLIEYYIHSVLFVRLLSRMVHVQFRGSHCSSPYNALSESLTYLVTALVILLTF
jgi:hypothetical protein